MMNRILICFFSGIVFTLFSTAVFCDTKETVVTTYVFKTQEERQSTRFTLTEWLRIKERMKMMDVWLAMFSDPKKDTFKPELNLIYARQKGEVKSTDDLQASTNRETISDQMKGQLWLTNLLTGSTGLHLVNIDFGLEGAQKNLRSPKGLKHSIGYYSANFRLFGANIQDSSIIAKVGKYEVKSKLHGVSDLTSTLAASGIFYGGEIQLYLFRWLGLEGSYQSYGSASYGISAQNISGSYADYVAYIEISLLRIFGGAYQEHWILKTTNGAGAISDESGYIGGVKIQL